ncbi:hypothetical protein CYMTET_24444, partial [Cymbomonas tetramitiformis]
GCEGGAAVRAQYSTHRGVTGASRDVRRGSACSVLHSPWCDWGFRDVKARQDVKEAQQCVHVLHVPFFHHELVKQSLNIAIEDSTRSKAILELLKTLAGCGQLSTNQIAWGFARMQDMIDDLNLDVPGAKGMLEELVMAARAYGVLPEVST